MVASLQMSLDIYFIIGRRRSFYLNLVFGPNTWVITLLLTTHDVPFFIYRLWAFFGITRDHTMIFNLIKGGEIIFCQNL
jgi:hypothetical protein